MTLTKTHTYTHISDPMMEFVSTSDPHREPSAGLTLSKGYLIQYMWVCECLCMETSQSNGYASHTSSLSTSQLLSSFFGFDFITLFHNCNTAAEDDMALLSQ